MARRSVQEIEAAGEMDAWALMIIGTREAVPRYAGDNELTWAVRVVLTDDPRRRAGQIDREQLVHAAVVHVLVWGFGRSAGEALKAHVEEMIGDGRERVHGAAWNCEASAAELIVAHAAEYLEIDVMDTEAKDRRVTARAKRRMRAG